MNKRLSELETKEEFIGYIREMTSRHLDRMAACQGKEDALMKRLQDHRKAKRLANKRADEAIATMKAMIEKLEGDKP